MAQKPRLTDLQRLLLNTALHRPDAALLPPCESLGERTPAIDKAIASLVRRGLVEHLETTDDPDMLNFRISDAGRAAFATVPAADDVVEGTELPASELLSTYRATKASQVLAMLQRENGTTLEELVAATGWQPHTTRAALTGMRRKGHALTSEKIDGVRRYRVAVPAEAGSAR